MLERMDESDQTKAAARDAAAAHLRAAVTEIDSLFGDGYARAHPELVSAMVQATAIEAAVEAGRMAHAEALELATRISRETNETILRLKPRLFG